MGNPNINITSIDPVLKKQKDLMQHFDRSPKKNLKPNIKALFRVMDEQDAVNKFTWYNLPNGLTGQMIERILYYKGQGMFFYDSGVKQFFFLPYALEGGIDIYGRYEGVKPLPFNGSTEIKKGEKLTPLAKYITNLTRVPLYDLNIDELKPGDVDKYCVLLSDYSKQISQHVIPRADLNDPLLDVMSDLVPFTRTALLNGTGVMGMRIDDADAAEEVYVASAAIDDAALCGEKYIPITGNIEFQELTGGTVSKSEEYLLALQALDNLRLSTHGLDNGGLFQKKSHVLEAEQEMNTGSVGLIMQDGLTLRQHACLIFYSFTGWPIWCDVSENAIGLDKNMDGQVGDNQMDAEGGSVDGDNVSQSSAE